jgi:hypothetical protein
MLSHREPNSDYATPNSKDSKQETDRRLGAGTEFVSEADDQERQSNGDSKQGN